MENQKNTGLRVPPPRHCKQKRKLPNDGTVQEQEPAIKEMCQALKEMESELQNLRDDNNQLRDELLGKDRQLVETRAVLVDREHKLSNTQTLLVDREQQLAARTLLVDTKELETEIFRLKRLLAEKNDTNNYAAPEKITEVIEKQTPVSLKDETEGLSLSIYHEATGYDFSLTWLEQADGGEWAYKYSSLGTLEGMALKWMKWQDIRFSMEMFPVFFERISSLIRRGR